MRFPRPAIISILAVCNDYLPVNEVAYARCHPFIHDKISNEW